jgi:hypothetical protein
LAIGGCRADFWGLTPKTIQIDFEAYRLRKQREAQDRWEIGAYVKCALKSTILVATLAEKSTVNKIPDFPKMPFEPQKNEDYGNMTEEQLKAERLKAWIFFKSMRKNKQ